MPWSWLLPQYQGAESQQIYQNQRAGLALAGSEHRSGTSKVYPKPKDPRRRRFSRRVTSKIPAGNLQQIYDPHMTVRKTS